MRLMGQLLFFSIALWGKGYNILTLICDFSIDRYGNIVQLYKYFHFYLVVSIIVCTFVVLAMQSTFKHIDMKTLLALITLALLLTSCGNNEYKPFDTGIKIIQAEYSLDSLDREIQARHRANIKSIKCMIDEDLRK